MPNVVMYEDHCAGFNPVTGKFTIDWHACDSDGRANGSNAEVSFGNNDTAWENEVKDVVISTWQTVYGVTLTRNDIRRR